MFSISLSRYPEYTKLFFHPFETLKIKVGKKHSSPLGCARPPGGDIGSAYPEVATSVQMVQQRLLHTRWSNTSDLQFT